MNSGKTPNSPPNSGQSNSQSSNPKSVAPRLNIGLRLLNLLDRLLPVGPLSGPADSGKVKIQTKRKGLWRQAAKRRDSLEGPEERAKRVEALIRGRTLQKQLKEVTDANGARVTFDALEDELVKQFKPTMDGAYGGNWYQPQVPEIIAQWFSAQSFIGQQMCAMLAQHWLVDKACTIPAEDAIRKGWEITLNDGNELTPEQLDFIRKKDVEYKVMENLKEYVQFSRVFGVRVCIFLIDSTDKDYYEKPFNIDSVTPGKYKGMSQVDPYWIAPELDMEASANPINKNFYVPTWWRMGGLKAHRSHMTVLIPFPVADILKPTYLFGGIPLTQKLFEHVYNAERCSAEAVQLLMTKRSNVLFLDMEEALADEEELQSYITEYAYYRDNYGVKLFAADERYEQHDTSLSDLDNTILTQFKLVAAVAGIPASKLLQDSPAGSLNATGEYELETYREMLESIQENDLTPLLTRHYQLMARSDLAEKWPELKDANFVIKWNELDALTESERADINQKKAQTDQTLASAGALDGKAILDRLIKDKHSGYGGMELELPEEPTDDNDETDDMDKPGDDGEQGSEPNKE